MKYIEAPQYSVEISKLPAHVNIFLAGSITGAQDWQKELAYANLRDYPRIIDLFNVFNPRRANYNALDPALELEQITWEHHCIHKKCEHILFWFAPETLAPITLFELGSALHTHDHSKIYIGIDPEYKRKNDVIIQTQLRNKTLAKRIVFSKQDLLEQIIKLNS
jgi:hypothetical protein